MNDLAGKPVPPDALVITVCGHGTTIDQAPPVIQISPQNLKAVLGRSWAKLSQGPPAGFVGRTLTIVGTEQRVVYLITHYDGDDDLYTMRWPD